jgi:hypothetical protein
MFVRPSVRPYGKTRFPLDGFSLNLTSDDVSKVYRENSSFPKIRITGVLHEDLRTFTLIPRRILLKTRNVSDKSCRENQNTHFMFKTLNPKIAPFMI